jgi:hypothetical protein
MIENVRENNINGPQNYLDKFSKFYNIDKILENLKSKNGKELIYEVSFLLKEPKVIHINNR